MANNRKDDHDEAKLRHTLRSELRRAAPASASAQGDLQRAVDAALRRTLGQRPTDAKSFREALTRSFESNDAESEGEPMSGTPAREALAGLTIAQSSLYALASIVRDNALPRLDRLYALLPDADPQVVQANTRLARKYILKLVSEMGKESGPIERRVIELFEVLLGAEVEVVQLVERDSIMELMTQYQQGRVQPEAVLLRLYISLFGPLDTPPDINTIEEYQDVVDFEVVFNLVGLLFIAWQWYRAEKDKDLSEIIFLLRRTLRAIADAVANVEFEMDSANFDDDERQLVMIKARGTGAAHLPQVSVADWLEWLRDFVTDTAVDAIDDAGARGIHSLAGELEQLLDLTDDLIAQRPVDDLDVERALKELREYLNEATKQIKKIKVPDYREDRSSPGQSESE